MSKVKTNLDSDTAAGKRQPMAADLLLDSAEGGRRIVEGRKTAEASAGEVTCDRRELMEAVARWQRRNLQADLAAERRKVGLLNSWRDTQNMEYDSVELVERMATGKMVELLAHLVGMHRAQTELYSPLKDMLQNRK